MADYTSTYMEYMHGSRPHEHNKLNHGSTMLAKDI